MNGFLRCFALKIPFWIKMISWDVHWVVVLFPATVAATLHSYLGKEMALFFYILCYSPYLDTVLCKGMDPRYLCTVLQD